MKVLIVDDEPLARERLAQLLEGAEDCEVVGGAVDGRQALERIQERKPQLVLMDVQMPGMSGIEAAHHLQQLDHRPAVVFCTAFDQYALEAFDASAIDYLVKPVRRERLLQAIDKVRRYQDVAPISPKPRVRTHLCARMRGGLELIPVHKIIFLLAEHKYVSVVHEAGETLIEEPLKALEQEFESLFIRVHRNALVACTRLIGLEKTANGNTVTKLSGTERKLEVSRRNLPEIRRFIKEH